MAYSTKATDSAYEYIVSKIRSGEWQPGQQIDTETQLCEQLGLSRSAIRQAIAKLCALSVLRKTQGSGTFVERPEDSSLLGLSCYSCTRENMLTILEFRLMFDSYNTELFIRKCSPEDIIPLVDNYHEMVAARDDTTRFRFLDHQFHDLIAKGTRNPVIIQISNVFLDVLTQHQLFLYRNVGPEEAIKHHGQILECIQNGNAELASIYSRLHIENSIEMLTHLSEEEILK